MVRCAAPDLNASWLLNRMPRSRNAVTRAARFHAQGIHSTHHAEGSLRFKWIREQTRSSPGSDAGWVQERCSGDAALERRKDQPHHRTDLRVHLFEHADTLVRCQTGDHPGMLRHTRERDLDAESMIATNEFPDALGGPRLISPPCFTPIGPIVPSHCISVPLNGAVLRLTIFAIWFVKCKP